MSKTKSVMASAMLGIAIVTLGACGGGLETDMVEAEGGYEIDILKLDGSETLAFDPDPKLAPNEQSTIEFWVQPQWNEVPDFDPVVLSNYGTEGASYLIAISAERDGILIASDDMLEAAPFDFTDDELHHVALVDYGDSVRLLVDLEYVADLPITFESLPSNGLYIGSADDSGDAFTGLIGGLRIWSVAVEDASLAQFARRDVADEPAHPDVDALKLISDFINRTVIIGE